MRTMINNASDVLIASDDDREGEAIGYHIIETFGLPVDEFSSMEGVPDTIEKDSLSIRPP